MNTVISVDGLASSSCAGHQLHQETHSKSSMTLRKLYWAIAICSFFMCAEIVGGLAARSLAIITDAVHLLSDVAGFFTSIVAVLVARRQASHQYSFGFQRAQSIGAFASMALVWMLTIYLIIEAIERIRNPEEIDGKIMFFVALLGLAVNIVMAFTLSHDHGHHKDAHTSESTTSLAVEDLNIRAAFIHVIGDLIQSIGVLIASALIWYNPSWRIADPICTLFFSILVFISTVFISKQIILILMEGTPKEINPLSVATDLLADKDVSSVHDLHIWSLAPGNISLTVHVKLKSNLTEQDSDQILERLQSLICTKYGIHHTTIQMESVEGRHCSPAHCVK